MRRPARRVTVLAAVLATGATLAAAFTAQAAGQSDDAPPSTVEDFSYPGAAQILAQQQVQLVSGDGHIVLAQCPTGPDTVGLIMVRSTDPVGANHDGRICFHVLAATGQLTLKIPAVFSIRGDGLQAGQGHKLKAKLTTDNGTESTVDVNPSGTTQVGIATSPPGDATTLLRLDASS